MTTTSEVLLPAGEGLSWLRQTSVDQARVLVAGCGALGNEVLKNLVLSGIRHIVVIDFDRVEPSNLTRSILFRQQDAALRRLKVETVAERLRQINPALQLLPLCGDVAHDVGLGLLRRMDVAIGCVDNRLARYALNRLCMRAGIPWVDGGISRLEGTARVFRPGENCYACNLGPEGLNDLARRMPCAGTIRRNETAHRAPTTSLIASIIGAVQVQEALKLLQPDTLASGETVSLCGKMFHYDGQYLTTRLVEFRAYDDECPVHEPWWPVQPSSITPATSIGEALRLLGQQLGTTDLSLLLDDDCFVDGVERMTDGRYIPLQLPGREVAAFIDRHPDLRGTPLQALRQHEYHRIDRQFPYPALTLARLGIPPGDVLHITDNRREWFVEMDMTDYTAFCTR